jgi:hypothetical protein
MSLLDIIRYSSNVGCAKIIEEIGHSKQQDFFERYSWQLAYKSRQLHQLSDQEMAWLFFLSSRISKCILHQMQ